MGLEAEHRNLLRSIRRTAVLRGFLAHVLIFLAGMIMLNLSDASLQILPIISGWLIGLLLHGAMASGLGQYIGEEWEERRFEDILHSRNNGHRNISVQDPSRATPSRS